MDECKPLPGRSRTNRLPTVSESTMARAVRHAPADSIIGCPTAKGSADRPASAAAAAAAADAAALRRSLSAADRCAATLCLGFFGFQGFRV